MRDLVFSGRVDWIRTSDPLTPSYHRLQSPNVLPAALCVATSQLHALYHTFTHKQRGHVGFYLMHNHAPPTTIAMAWALSMKVSAPGLR